MTHGILLVDTSWANHAAATIEKAAYLRHGEQLTAGTKALIYVRAPVDAIVAEAEISGAVVATETVLPDPANPPSLNSGRSARAADLSAAAAEPPLPGVSRELAPTFHVPLQIVRLKGRTPPLGFNRLRALLGTDFSVYDETWIPLSGAQYRAITALWRED